MATALTHFVVWLGVLTLSVSSSAKSPPSAMPCSQPQALCDSYCGQAPTFSPCHCDSLCLLYQDCCEGFNTSCPDVHRAALHWRGRHPDVRPRCQPDGSGKVLEGCGPREGKETLAAKCSRRSRLEDPALFPVSFPDLGLSFANRYCALCNNISSKYLEVWKMGTPLNITDASNLSSPDAVEEMLANVLNQIRPPSASSKLAWRPPQGGSRPCLPKAVSQCPDLETGGKLSAECSGYASYVKGESGRVFLNRHCALCNGEAQCSLVSAEDFGMSGLSEPRFSSRLRGGSLDSGDSFVLMASWAASSWLTMSCSVVPSLNCSIETCLPFKTLSNGLCQERLYLTVAFCWVGDSTDNKTQIGLDSFTHNSLRTSQIPESTTWQTSTQSTTGRDQTSEKSEFHDPTWNGKLFEMSNSTAVVAPETSVPTTPEKSHGFTTRHSRRSLTSFRGCRDDFPLEVLDLAKLLLHETGRFLAALSPHSHFDDASVAVRRRRNGKWQVRGVVLSRNATELISAGKAKRASDHFPALLHACMGDGTTMEGLDMVCMGMNVRSPNSSMLACYDPSSTTRVQHNGTELLGPPQDLEAKCRALSPSVQVFRNTSTASHISNASSRSGTAWQGLAIRLQWWFPLLVCWLQRLQA